MAVVVAIIGHRDLREEDRETIRGDLADAWPRLVQAAPGQPVSVLTSLAPGADQLAASLLVGSQQHVKLQLVLPFNEDTYFERVRRWEEEHPAQESDLEGLRAAVDPGDSVCLNRSCAEPDAERAASCYRDAGRYLVENADLLIALWDGVYQGKVGGTSDTVAYALSRECQKKRALAGREPIQVHWYGTPRESNPYPAGESLAWQGLGGAVAVESLSPENFKKRPLRKSFVVVPIALALLSIVCSTVGYYGNLTDVQARDVGQIADRALKAISHLTLNALDSPIEGPGAVLIRVGRWLAVLFALTGVASVMNGLFRWVDRWTLRRVRSRRHDLVCGLGWRGRGLVAESVSGRTPVIAIERKPDEGTRDLCARLAVPLIEGDATDREIVSKVGIEQVESVFVTTNDDETSMRIVHQLAKLKPHSGRRMECCVGLHQHRVFQVLQNALPVDHWLDLRIFSPESVTARMLLQEHPLDRFAASPMADGAEVILIGDSLMAETLARQVLLQGIFEDGKELSLSLLTPDSEASCRKFVMQNPVFQAVPPSPTLPGVRIAEPPRVWLKERVLPRLRFLDLPQSERGLTELFEGDLVRRSGSWATTVLVAAQEPAASAVQAYALAPRLEAIRRNEKRDVTLGCYYNVFEDGYRRDVAEALNLSFPALPVVVFSDFMGNPSRRAVRGDDVDRVARRVHGTYSLSREECLAATFDSKCDTLWFDVSEIDKESNRQAGAHAWVKQRVRRRLQRSGHTSASIEEALAAIEHRRWCAQSLLDGMRSLTRIPSEVANFSLTDEEQELIAQWFGTPGFKASSKKARRHVDLVPLADFDRLFPPDRAEQERRKDLDQIRALDVLLG